MFTRIQRRFFKKIAGGVLIAFGSITVTVLCIMFWHHGIGLDKDTAGAAGLITVLGTFMGVTGVQIAWSRAKWEVEEETRKVEEALKR